MSVGGVYGNPVLAFPEQVQTLAYFDMVPLNTAGYGPPTDVQSIDGIIQCIERRIKDQNGNLVTTRECWLWTEAALLSGRFIRDEDQIIYRIGSDSEWQLRGGFTKYTVYRVTGGDAEATNDDAMSVGTGSFG